MHSGKPHEANEHLLLGTRQQRLPLPRATQLVSMPVHGTPQMRTMSGRRCWKKLVTIL